VNPCPVLGVPARGVPEGTGNLCDEVDTTIGELVLSPATVVLETKVGVLARGVLRVPGLAADVPTTLGEQSLTPVPGVLLTGVVSLCPEIAPMLGEPILGPAAVVPGVVALGVVEAANLGPCPEAVKMLGELVLTPAGLANVCAALVTADGVLARGAENL